ncbi:MAG: SRPBCC domain-containing protein, partial [Culicoidibacterales bacterium]
MKTVTQAIIIEAPIARVWSKMIHQHSYQKWTRVFGEKSMFSGEWQLGANLQFTDGDVGMVAEVITYAYPHEIGLKYTALIEAGQVITTTNEAKLWQQSTEVYSFEPLDQSTTRFTVNLTCPTTYYLGFEQMWAQALIALKQLCEHDALPPKLTVTAQLDYPITEAWHHWLEPKSIQQWNHASDDWYSPKAVHDLRIGGSFCYTLAAKDGSFSFDFTGIFTEIIPYHYIALLLSDGRSVQLHFI